MLELNPSCKCLKRKDKRGEIGVWCLRSENCQVWKQQWLTKFGSTFWINSYATLRCGGLKYILSTKDYYSQVVQWKIRIIIFLIKAPSCNVGLFLNSSASWNWLSLNCWKTVINGWVWEWIKWYLI